MSEKVVKRNWAVKGDSDHLLTLPQSASAKPQLAGDSQLGGAASLGSDLPSGTDKSDQDLQEPRAQALAELEQELDSRREEHEKSLAATTLKHEQELASRRKSMEQELRGELQSEFRQRYEQALTSLESAAASLGQDRDTYLKQVELPALELVLEISRQLLCKEISTDSSILGGLIVKALGMLKPQEVVAVKLHPATFHLLLENESFNAALSKAGFSADLVELAIDDSLEPDQFRAELGGMRIEFGLQDSISGILGLLKDEISTAAPPPQSAGEK